MVDLKSLKFRLVRTGQRFVVNPLARRSSSLTMLETTGRKSGLPRFTPIGGRRQGDSFWLVSEHGYRSDYVRNIQADPHVRLRLRGQWRSGTATLLPDDDTAKRLDILGGLNSVGVRVAGTDLLTIRIDLEPAGS
ncbi:nitroreductase [Mycobacterium sp. 852013-50091_SCH5140682]|uniref:nitroreductase/quinone reductase family protein n=1 Tax=Mycobacterium sp. 852013-50091_SCH5140682 TaxID=1834109 RepID=UPI0007EA8EB0|nr:nitroreductase/quinone reductase family protein [Mycobacterium sp. 852013-50091_SCH5140682]OBC01268.1 nitroreductase [Mycobacterium sp. 852013-50091_SCH5140682]